MTPFLLGILFFVSWMPLASNAELWAGYGEENITPELGVTMPGYFTERKAEGVLDPLLAKALVLQHGKTQIAIVAVDLIGLKKPIADRIRNEIETTIQIPADHVFLHATHTHTGATVDEIQDNLPGQIARAVQKAARELKPVAETRYGISENHDVAFIRRFLMKDGTIRTNPGRGNPQMVHPVGEIDPTVHVLSFPEIKTLLVHFGLHLDCIGGTHFSADYPYHLTQAVKKERGEDWNVVFLNACCGNVNHIDVHNPQQKKGYEDSQRIGQSLGESVFNALKQSVPFSIDSLSAQTEQIECRYRTVPSDWIAWAKEQMDANPEEASQRKFNEYTPSKILELAAKEGQTETAEIIALRLGTLGVAGLPAEVFVEIGRDIQLHSLTKPTLVVGLTGGAMGYVPHRRGYEEGGYEATFGSARYSEETPLLWAKTAVQMLNAMIIQIDQANP